MDLSTIGTSTTGALLVSSGWFLSLLITIAGVFLALMLQELIGYLSKKRRLSKLYFYLLLELRRNLKIVEGIIESCGPIKVKSREFISFIIIDTIIAQTLQIETKIYKLIQQGDLYLIMSSEKSLEISRIYSRLTDIKGFVEVMKSSWISSESDADREGITKSVVDNQRKTHIQDTIDGTRTIAEDCRKYLQDTISKLSAK